MISTSTQFFFGVPILLGAGAFSVGIVEMGCAIAFGDVPATMGFAEWRELTALAALIILCMTIGRALVLSNKELVLETKNNTHEIAILSQTIRDLVTQMVNAATMQQQRTDKAVETVVGRVDDLRDELRERDRANRPNGGSKL